MARRAGHLRIWIPFKTLNRRHCVRWEEQQGADGPNYKQSLLRHSLAADPDEGRTRIARQRIGTVEPVFANIRHNKRMSRFNLRGKDKVNTQWHLYCMVRNIEKLANSGWMQ